MPVHLFPAPADKNRGHYCNGLLFRYLICFCFFVFIFTKRNFHIFQLSIISLHCPSQVTLQVARSWLGVSGQQWTASLSCTHAGGATSVSQAEQLSLDSVENPEVQMWIQIGLKNLMRSGFLGLPAFSLSSMFNINELSVF